MQKKNTELGKDLSFLTAKTPISGLAVVRACTEKSSELQGKNIGPKKSDPARRLKVIQFWYWSTYDVFFAFKNRESARNHLI
jgi:hypothetical protein